MSGEEHVLILRDMSRSRRTGAGGRRSDTILMESLSSPNWAPPGGVFPRLGADPHVAVEARDKHVLDEAGRDPTVVAVADAMPLGLIEPLSDAELSPAELLNDAVSQAQAEGITWGVKAVKADVSPFSGNNVTVAVLDTGIDLTHPAFSAPDLQIFTKDFTGTVNEDTHGHGTHCAGTIFGRDVDGVRIGVAPGVRRALIGKVIGGSAGTEALIAALEWATSNGAQVISMSLGFNFIAMRDRLVAHGLPEPAAISRALQAFRDNIRLFDEWMALNAARQAGNAAVVVAASGNESRRNLPIPYEIGASSPSAANDVISVGALSNGDTGLSVASFSNTNPDIAAPGVSVVSARLGGGLAAMSGTSMACPHVAGLAALYWDQLIQSPVPTQPVTVVNRLLANARYAGVFTPDIDMTDVGVGLAVAP